MSNEKTNLKDFMKSVEKMHVNCLTVSKELLEDGKENVTLNLANKPVAPERMESPPVAHVFYNLKDFEKYIIHYGTNKKIVVMGDYETMSMRATLNENAENGREIVTMKNTYHPLFNMLKEVLSNFSDSIRKTMLIREFANACLLNRGVIVGPGDKASFAMMMQQITVSQKVTNKIGAGSKGVNGVVCEHEVKGSVGKEDVTLPDYLVVKCPIYLETEPVEFRVELTIQVKQMEVYVVLRSPDLEVKKQQLFEKQLDEVNEALKDDIVGCGRLNYGEWKYNE